MPGSGERPSDDAREPYRPLTRAEMAEKDLRGRVARLEMDELLRQQRLEAETKRLEGLVDDSPVPDLSEDDQAELARNQARVSEIRAGLAGTDPAATSGESTEDDPEARD